MFLCELSSVVYLVLSAGTAITLRSTCSHIIKFGLCVSYAALSFGLICLDLTVTVVNVQIPISAPLITISVVQVVTILSSFGRCDWCNVLVFGEEPKRQLHLSFFWLLWILGLIPAIFAVINGHLFTVITPWGPAAVKVFAGLSLGGLCSLVYCSLSCSDRMYLKLASCCAVALLFISCSGIFYRNVMLGNGAFVTAPSLYAACLIAICWYKISRERSKQNEEKGSGLID
jgi:hypothetical protein